MTSVVYPGHHEIGLFFQESGQCQVDAVRRRAVDAIPVVPDLPDAQRILERQGMARRRPVPIRRDDDDVGDFGEGLCQHVDPGRLIAIVVAYEDPHN